METASEMVIHDQLVLLVMALFFGLAASYTAYRFGYFRHAFEFKVLKEKMRFMQALGAFFSFLSVQLFVVPLLLFSYQVLKTGELPVNGLFSLGPEVQGWFTVVTMVLSLLAVLGFYQLQSLPTKLLIWQRGEPKGFLANKQSFFLGAASWLIAYPTVFFVGHGLSLLIYFFTGEAELEQVAVKSLKATENHPALYGSMVVGMVILVPIMEELLFRGFLQTWLRGRVQPFNAIFLTSLVFALFHYSYSQGLSNIEYLVALLLLSGFLGYLYEREKNLWAPIGLHVMFNAVSILIISLS